MSSKPRIVIVGGGGTAAAVSYDLAARGYRSLLLEKGSLTSGTTGRHHGLLHSGARYAVADEQAATECWHEAQILRKITTDVIEDNGGLFVALHDIDDPDYAGQFEAGCHAIGIPIQALPIVHVRSALPEISSRLQRAYAVPDASFDAWRLPLQFFGSALQHGAIIKQFCIVTDIHTNQRALQGITYYDYQQNKECFYACDILINATGIWSNSIGALFGSTLSVNAQAGALVAIKGRMSDFVINRLSAPGDGDIIIPQRLLTIVGTTSTDCENTEQLEPSAEEIAYLIKRADEVFPRFSQRPVHAAWSAARPLAGSQQENPRAISRKTLCIDHDARDGVKGIFSVIGGKATTMRAMAEEMVDCICAHIGSDTPCTTAERKLLPFREFYALFNHDNNRITEG